MSNFSLSGITLEKDGMWGCKITLQTPDGNFTTMESDYVFSTSDEAETNLRSTLNKLIETYEDDHDVKVLKMEESKLQ